jgi:drug/metabolite transporter (DMT)-like permease
MAGPGGTPFASAAARTSTGAVELSTRSRAAGHVALWGVQLCFGLFPVFGKWALVPGAFSPLSIASWRIVFAAASLGILAATRHGRRALPSRKDLGLLALGSLLGISLNQVLYLEGLSRSTATNAGLMVCLIPVFTFAIAAIAGQEAFRAQRAVGLGVALVGASMLFWAESSDLVRAHGFGNFLMALNTLSYAGYLVLSRPLLRRHPPLVVIAWVFVFALPIVPFLSWADMLGHADGIAKSLGAVWFPPGASGAAWRSLAFILVFPTMLAYLLNVFALARLRASTAAVYVYLQSLITAAAGALLLGERPTAGTAAAAACIFFGIWLVSRPARAKVPVGA